MSAKMDGVHTRTPQQLEQKLDLGKRFAEVMGVATDARNAAEEAQNAVGSLDSELTAEEIYNRLTNNGTAQGLFRDNEGNLFVNADYIYALEKLFAKDINMSGKFTHTAKVFLEPEQEELDTIQRHILGKEYIPIDRIPLYDFNNNGEIDVIDTARVQKAMLGIISLADWSGAVKTDVTMTIDLSNPEKCIRIQGVNMWGRTIDKYIGVNYTNIKIPSVEQRLDAVESELSSSDYVVDSGASYKEGDGGGICWYYEKKKNGNVELWGQGSLLALTEIVYDLPEGMLTEVNGCWLSLHIEEGVSFTPDVRINAYANTSTVTVRANRATQGNGFYFSLLVKGTWK